MNNNLLRSLSTLLAWTVLWPLNAAGQHPSLPDSLCRAYVTTAYASPDSGVRISELKRCGPSGASAIAQLIRSANTHHDEAYSSNLLFLSQVTSPGIQAAAASLVQDRSAPVDSRLVGLSILVQQYLGATAGIAFPDGTPPERMTPQTSCLLIGNRQAPPARTTSLRLLTENLMNDPTQPGAIRTASRCVPEGLKPKYVPHIEVSRVKISPACLGGARVRNELDELLTLTWKATVGTKHGAIKVREHNQMIFTPGVEGKVNFYSEDGSQFVGQVVLSEKLRCK
jgi:hypothetical protein